MKLSLAEGFYLIALDDEEGRLLSAVERTFLDGILACGILELYISKKISLTNGVIHVLDKIGTGNGILDKILNKLRNGEKIADEISLMRNHFKDIKNDMDLFLEQRGILKREETKLLWIPLSQRMDNANYAFELEIRKALRSIVFDNAKPSTAFVILFSLIYFCDLLGEVFPDKDDYIDAVKSAKEMSDVKGLDHEIGYAIKELKKHFGK